MEGFRVKYTIEGIEEAKNQIEQLQQIASRTDAEGLKVVNEEIQKLETYLKGAEDSFKLFNSRSTEGSKNLSAFNKENAKFGDLIVENEHGMVELTASISKLEDHLYHLRATGQANTEEFEQVRSKVAEFKQVIIETDREIDQMAENTGFAAIGGGLSTVTERLAKLDFEGAAKSAKILNTNMGNLGTAGAKAIKGLTTTVTQLTGAFIKMGVALLANPIFLIVAAVTAIVVAIVALMQKLGILQPIIDGISFAFGKLKEGIDFIIQAFKDFTDWLGLTDNAGKAFVDGQIKEFDKYSEVMQDYTERRIFALDEEAKIAQIKGEDVLQIEREKQRQILKTAKAENERLKVIIEAASIREDIDNEEIERLEKKFQENEKLIRQSSSELRILEAKEAQKAKDDEAKTQKEREDEAKRSAERAKKYAQDRLAAQRQITDLSLAQLQDGVDKEVQLNTEKYKRLIEDTKRSEVLLSSEKTKIIEILQAEQLKKESELLNKANLERLELERVAREEAKKAAQAEQDEFLLELENHLEELNISRLSNSEREVTQIQDKYFELIEKARKYGEDVELLETARDAKIKEIRDKAYLTELESEADTFSKRLFLLQEQQRIELENTELTESEKTEIAKKYSQQRAELITSEVSNGLNVVSSMLSAFSDLNNARMEAELAGAEGNEKKQNEIRKKAFEQNKKMQIAQATVQMITGAISAFSGAMSLGPIAGPIVGGLLAATVLATGAMNIKRIKSTKFESSGGDGGSAPTAPSTPDITNATPEVNMFGSANQFSEGGQPKAQEKNALNVNVSISENEITNTQSTVKKQVEFSSL